MIEILLKSSAAIIIGLLFYKLVLQQESFFATNRLYLLSCILLAFVLPFISLPKLMEQQGYLEKVFEISEDEASKITFSTPLQKEKSETPFLSPVSESKPDILPSEEAEKTAISGTVENSYQNTAVSEENSATDGSWIPVLSLEGWLLLLYFLGAAILSLSLLIQLGCIFFQIIRSQDKIRDGEYTIVNTATRKAPCSFFKYIFIFPDEYDFETYEQILKHEKTHVRLGHSFDLLLAELAVIVLWFNPFIWLFKKEIVKNNEYQTDSILLEKEQVRKDKYQLNLLQIAVPNKPLNITTNYNQSLIKQRIVMMNSKRSTPRAYWKYSFLVPLFFGTTMLLNEPALAQEKEDDTSTEKVGESENSRVKISQRSHLGRERQKLLEHREVVTRERVQERVAMAEARSERIKVRITDEVEQKNLSFTGRTSQVDVTKGVWYSSVKNGKYCIEFRGGDEEARWNMSDCFETSEFQKKRGDTFVMINEVGVLELKGNLDAEVGQGKYTFTEDDDFRKFIEQNDIASLNKSTMFHLFFSGMTKKYISFLKQEYPNVEGDDITALAIHNIKQDEFQRIVKLLENYLTGKPEISDIVGLKIHGVTEGYVTDLQKMGFTNLSLEDIMSAKIHGVSTSYFQDLQKAGFTDLSIEEIVTARIHGVQPQTIKKMRALGAKNLDEIVKLQIHGVSAEYVKDLRATGLRGLSLEEITSAKIHGLQASTINEIRNLGYKQLNFDDLLAAQIHGIDSAFVKGLKKAGFPNLKMNEVVSAKIHGINGEFIENARKEGYDLSSIDKYISLKIHGSAMESLKNKGK